MTPGSGGAGDLDAVMAALERTPDFDAAELRAFDGADLHLLETVGPELRSLPPGRVAVIGDRHGAISIASVAVYGAKSVRVYQDPLLGERALQRNARRAGVAEEIAHAPLGPELLAGAAIVLLRLPRGHHELAEIADAIARWAPPRVTVFAVGRDKHMSRSMNDLLGREFTEVSAGLGARKSRIITARGPRERIAEPPFPVWGRHPMLPFAVAAFGATFGGAALDRGSRLLLETLQTHPPVSNPRRVLDLGCGNGVLAVSAALRYPEAEVIASDQSIAAVNAANLTAQAAGVAERVRVIRADGTEEVPDGWADLILLNPPFHAGATVHAGIAHRLIRSCSPALAAGGEARIVFNSHLRYRRVLSSSVGPVEQLARDRSFTVLSARHGPPRR